MAFSLPEIPAKAKDYLWVLALMVAFAGVTAVFNRFVGSSSSVPLPPITIQASEPVIIQQDSDGVMTVLKVR